MEACIAEVHRGLSRDQEFLIFSTTYRMLKGHMPFRRINRLEAIKQSTHRMQSFHHHTSSTVQIVSHIQPSLSLLTITPLLKPLTFPPLPFPPRKPRTLIQCPNFPPPLHRPLRLLLLTPLLQRRHRHMLHMPRTLIFHDTPLPLP